MSDTTNIPIKALIKQINRLSREANIETVIQFAKSALRQHPDFGPLYQILAQLYLVGGYFSESITCMKITMCIYPERPTPLKMIAKYNFDMQSYNLSGEFFRKLSCLKPDHMETEKHLLLCYIEDTLSIDKKLFDTLKNKKDKSYFKFPKAYSIAYLKHLLKSRIINPKLTNIRNNKIATLISPGNFYLYHVFGYLAEIKAENWQNSMLEKAIERSVITYNGEIPFAPSSHNGDASAGFFEEYASRLYKVFKTLPSFNLTKRRISKIQVISVDAMSDVAFNRNDFTGVQNICLNALNAKNIGSYNRDTYDGVMPITQRLHAKIDVSRILNEISNDKNKTPKKGDLIIRVLLWGDNTVKTFEKYFCKCLFDSLENTKLRQYRNRIRGCPR